MQGKFDSLFSSFVLVFRVLTLDDWNSITFGGVRCMEYNWVVFGYFISWLVLGNFMLLNLFLAILIRSFERMKDRKETVRKELEAAAADQLNSTDSTPATTPASTPLQTARQLGHAVFHHRGSVTSKTQSGGSKLDNPRTPMGSVGTIGSMSPVLENATRRMSAATRVFAPPRESRAPSIRTEQEEKLEEHVRDEVSH